MSPHLEGRKRAPSTLIKQQKEKGGTGEEKAPLSPRAGDSDAVENSAANVKLLEHLVAQEHLESWCMHRS